MQNNSPFNEYSDEPLYNIQAVAEQTDVPSLTLRAWERRYDIPKPQRDTQGHRLYSERDILMIKWLKQQVDSSMRIKQAVQLLHSQNPQHLVSKIVLPAISTTAPMDSQFEQLVDSLYQAIQDFDYPQSQLILTHALSIYAIEDVCLGILVPVFNKIGQGFLVGEISLQIEHFGSNLIRERLLGILTTPSTPNRVGRIVIGCAPHEWHEIGALIFSLFLRRRGWEVIYLGQNVGFDGLYETVRQLNPDLFTLSITNLSNLRYLADASHIVNESTENHAIFSFAGQAFNNNHIAPMVDQLPGVFLGADLVAGVEKVDQLLEQRWQQFDYTMPSLPENTQAAWQYVRDHHSQIETAIANVISQKVAPNPNLEVSNLAQQFTNILLVSLQYNTPELNGSLGNINNGTLFSMGMDNTGLSRVVDALINYWQISAPKNLQTILIEFTKHFAGSDVE